MAKINNYIKSLSNVKKISLFVGLIITVMIFSFAIPSLARYKNRMPIDINTVWDGTIAESFRSGEGTKEEPYIISNGSELAFLASQLKNKKEDYKDKYFKLSNNIVLNNGMFNYDGTIKYTLNTSEFYLKEYTNEFYDNEEYTGVKIGTINVFESLENFNGHFDGNGHIIYGLYTYSEENELALFTNLTGTVENLYLKNSMIYGGTITAGVASTTNNAVLKNISNEGFVIGLDEVNEKTITNDLTDIEKIVETSLEETISTVTNLPTIKGEVISTTLSGKLEQAGNGNLKINNVLVDVDENGNFIVDLGNIIYTDITVSYIDASNTNYKLTNLKYNINYKELISGGIVGVSQNTTYENIINKAQVYGNVNSAGMVGLVNGSVSINQGYNNGKITAYENASGIIGAINYNSDNINISKIYNTGEINATNVGGIVANIKESTGNITIQNTINVGNNYAINLISNSNVKITNSYITEGSSTKTGVSNGRFELSTELYKKEYQLNTLLYNEFIDNTDVEENASNVWVYEYESLPILHIDDLNNPLATLYVNTNSWNDLGYELSEVYYDNKITFSIEQVSELRPIREIYYYLSNSETALTKSQIENILEWQPYTDIVQIEEEGTYVIYVKIVRDADLDGIDEVSYINSEVLVLDLSSPEATIKYDNFEWKQNKDVLEYVYIDKDATLTIEYSDSFSGIKEVNYYISDSMQTLEELKNIKDWTKYDNEITIDSIGSYIIYVKVVDNVGKTTYVNTDVITYGGYSLNNIYAGRNLVNNGVYITDKSNVTINYTYSDTNPYNEGYTHNIVSNQNLPINTKITLKDNISNKNYVYVVLKEESVIPFNLFKEIGTIGELYFKEEISDGINENYSINLDFSNTNLENNIIDLKLHLAIYDSDSIKVRTTLENTIRSINVYEGSAKTFISTSYNGTAISYDSNSETNIPLSLGVNYSYVNSNKIFDTQIEDKHLGIAVKLVDSEGNTIEKKYLKNIKYSILETDYGIDEDGIARINLNNSLNAFNGNLTIKTNLDNSELPSGNYYFKIYSYVSIDGKYTEEYSNDVVTVPVTNNTSKINYSFDVLLGEESRIISKVETNTIIHFDMLQRGAFYNPNIRISLYKKNELTAYNQDYTLVDLKDYITNDLESVTDKVYYASKYPLFYNGYKSTYNKLDLELINSKLENTGYKFVIELYEGNQKIGTIQKKIIAR